MIRRTLLASILVMALAIPVMASGKSRRPHDHGSHVSESTTAHSEYTSGDPVGSTYRPRPKQRPRKRKNGKQPNRAVPHVSIRNAEEGSTTQTVSDEDDKPEPYAKSFKELSDKVQKLDELLAAEMNKNSEQATEITTLKEELARRPLPQENADETPSPGTPDTVTPPSGNAPGTPQGANTGGKQPGDPKVKVGFFRENMSGFIGAGLALLLGTGFVWLKETDQAKKAQKAKIAVGFLIGNIVFWILCAIASAFPQIGW